MEEESNAFYVVRKGDVVGFYRNLKDCQSQVHDSSVSVYKGYSMRKEAEEYLVSVGLKNAAYSISSTHVTEALFGTLVPCTNQQLGGLFSSSFNAAGKTSKQKRPAEVLELDRNTQPDGLFSSLGKTSAEALIQKKPKELIKLEGSLICLLEFDGASKGNPGKAGAGAVLRSEDGSVVCRLREGLGVVTNNVAEYRAIILGMQTALKKGYERISVRGDSMLVCMQIQDLWKTKNQNIMALSMQAKDLKKKFLSFEINHVRREFNSEADALANMAITLESGEVLEDGPL